MAQSIFAKIPLNVILEECAAHGNGDPFAVLK